MEKLDSARDLFSEHSDRYYKELQHDLIRRQSTFVKSPAMAKGQSAILEHSEDERESAFSDKEERK